MAWILVKLNSSLTASQLNFSEIIVFSKLIKTFQQIEKFDPDFSSFNYTSYYVEISNGVGPVVGLFGSLGFDELVLKFRLAGVVQMLLMMLFIIAISLEQSLTVQISGSIFGLFLSAPSKILIKQITNGFQLSVVKTASDSNSESLNILFMHFNNCILNSS